MYKCIFLQGHVGLSPQCQSLNEHWASAVSPQMTEHYWTPQSNVSNETSTNKTFQRTISAQVHTHTHVRTRRQTSCCSLSDGLFLSSAGPTGLSLSSYHTLQDTLAYATALLNEKEQSGSSNGSEGSPANENAERSLRQVGSPTLAD